MIRENNIIIDSDKCLACGICVDRCIMDNLRLSLPPCRQADDLGINWQGIMRLIAQDRFEDAARELRRFAPLAGLLGKEDLGNSMQACTRKRAGNESLDFPGVLQWLLENYEEIVWTGEVKSNLPQRVAINCINLAALQAAYDLAVHGYKIDLFISPADLENIKATAPESIDKTLDMLKKMGVNVIIQEIKEIQADAYDALLLGENVKDGGIKVFVFPHKMPEKTGIALAEGGRIAKRIKNYLEGFPLDYELDERIANGLERFQGINLENVESRSGKTMGKQKLSREEVKEEAGRCLACGKPFEKNRTCWYCLPCEVACPTGAINVRMPYLIR